MNFEITRFDYYDPTLVQFAITGSNVGMTFMSDPGDSSISSTEETVGGHKYDVLGTYKATTVPGSVTARYLVQQGTMQLANNLAEAMKDMDGAYGTLYGIEYTASGVATHTATARCTNVSVRSSIDRFGAVEGKRHAIYVDCTWQRYTSWS